MYNTMQFSRSLSSRQEHSCEFGLWEEVLVQRSSRGKRNGKSAFVYTSSCRYTYKQIKSGESQKDRERGDRKSWPLARRREINNLSLSCKREDPSQLVRPHRTTTLASHCPFSFHLSLSRLLYVQILPPAIKITVVMFLLTAKYSFRFDCTSTDMNGRGKKRPAKRSTANEGFCVLLKLR